jgi:hypothetical protein
LIYYTRFIISLITFDIDRRHYNPSRVNPRLVTHTVGPSAPSAGKLLLSTVYNPTEIAVAVSVVAVNESYLHEHQTWANGKICKGFTGKFLSQEYTLFESFVGEAFNLIEIKAPLNEGWISFNCRPVDPGKCKVVLLFSYFTYFYFIFLGRLNNLKVSSLVLASRKCPIPGILKLVSDLTVTVCICIVLYIF